MRRVTQTIMVRTGQWGITTMGMVGLLFMLALSSGAVGQAVTRGDSLGSGAKGGWFDLLTAPLADPSCLAEGPRTTKKARQGRWQVTCPGDTAPRAVYHYRQGRLEGLAVLRDPTTGQLILEADLIDNRMTGLLRAYDPTTGSLYLEARMRDDLLHGLAVHYHGGLHNVAESEGFYVDSLREGLWAHYFRDGGLRDSGQYLGGLREGLWGNHDSASGRLVSQVSYRNGLPDSLAALWDTTGRPLFLPPGSYRGALGLWPVYEAGSGRLTEAFTVMSGDPTGRLYRYDSLGRVAVVGHQTRGERDSVWTYLTYDEAGLARILRREQPRPSGYVQRVWLYDDAGALRATGLETTATPPLPDSVWTIYLPDGATFQRLRYRQGRLVEAGAARMGGRELPGSRLPAGGTGPLKVYDLQGRLIAEGTYKAGQRQGTWKEYDPQSGERWEGTYQQDRKSGLWERRTRRGQLLDQVTYAP